MASKELRVKLTEQQLSQLQQVIDTATTAGFLCTRQDAFRVLMYLGASSIAHYQPSDLLRIIKQELGE